MYKKRAHGCEEKVHKNDEKTSAHIVLSNVKTRNKNMCAENET